MVDDRSVIGGVGGGGRGVETVSGGCGGVSVQVLVLPNVSMVTVYLTVITFPQICFMRTRKTSPASLYKFQHLGLRRPFMHPPLLVKQIRNTTLTQNTISCAENTTIPHCTAFNQ